MDRRAFTLILVLALLAGGFGYYLDRPQQPLPPPSLSAAATGVAVLKPGDAALNLRLPDLHGKRVSLERWRGRVIMLNFWASWCAPCRHEMPLLSKTQQRYASRGLQIIGIAMDRRQAVRGFLRKRPVDYPILLGLDSGDNVSLHYGDTMEALPFSALIDRKGRLVKVHLGAFTAQSLDTWLQSTLE